MELLTTTPRSARSIAADGARDISGLAFGYVPMGMAIGAAVADSGLNRLAGWLGAPLIAAGSAHLTLVELVSAGAGVLAAITAALAINARLIAYSAGLAPWFTHERRPMRLLIGVFIIDVTYLLAVRRFETDDPGPAMRRWYMLGMGGLLYTMWSVAIAAGVLAGSIVPPALELDKAATFMMVGLLAHTLDARGHRATAIAGALLGVMAGTIPAALVPALAAAVAVAISVGLPGPRVQEAQS